MVMQSGLPVSPYHHQYNLRPPPPPPMHAAPQEIPWQQHQQCNSPMSQQHLQQNCSSPLGNWDPRFASPLQAPMSPCNAPMSPLGGYQGGMSPLAAGGHAANYQGSPMMGYQQRLPPPGGYM